MKCVSTKNRLIGVTLCLLFLCCTASHSCAAWPSQLYAVVEIGCPGWTGSGTVVATTESKCLVLSCRHVSDHVGMAVTVKFAYLETAIPGKVVYVLRGSDYTTDLALIVCPRPRQAVPVKVAKFDPHNGPWFSVGWRDGKLRLATATEAHEEVGGIIESNVPFVQGMSGGATFDRYGRLVGVVVASDFKSVGISSDGPQLRALLRKYGKP